MVECKRNLEYFPVFPRLSASLDPQNGREVEKLEKILMEARALPALRFSPDPLPPPFVLLTRIMI